MKTRRGLLVGIIAVAMLHQGCFSSNSSGNSGGCDTALKEDGAPLCLFCGLGDTCPSPAVQPGGPVHGIRSDGRVDVTAIEAWPDRPPPAAALTPQQIADGCAVFAACSSSAPPSPDSFAEPAFLQNECLSAQIGFSPNVGERVIPVSGKNESFGFLIRGALASGGDCAQVNALLTSNQGAFACQEDGCWSVVKATVTCSGNIATVNGVTRDCSRADMQCAEDSPTGCTDRPLTLCKTGGMDRCDGDIKLGCDHCGFVSYHDCSWNGGTCVETPDGASCQDQLSAQACDGLPTGCSGTTLSVCVASHPVTVDCAALGLASCTVDPQGASFQGTDSDGGTPFTTAVCVPRGASAGNPDVSTP